MPAFHHEPIRYRVRFPASDTHDDPHYVEVEARFPCIAPATDQDAAAVELFLPVWTPGSYMVREYARHVEDVRATDAEGLILQVTKTRKNRWLVRRPNPSNHIIFSYRLYCNDLTVRTNFCDDTYAVLHGAATFITLINGCDRPYEVTLELPAQWAGAWSGLPGSSAGFTASNYDTLVDCPILAGNPHLDTFLVDEKPHTILNFGDVSCWDLARQRTDLAALVTHYRQMWQSLPYDRYLFFNLITGGRGALEHSNSMVLMADRFSMRTRHSYIAWLGLVSHEFFHVWNVKRLRPLELGPFDYENEVYTRNLWIAEGFTEYNGPLAVRRAGLMTTEEFLGSHEPPSDRLEPDSLSGWVENLQSTPGRLQQPAAAASFDAWIKLYRPDENSANSSMSYYTKGAVIAWLLDAKIRTATGGRRSLDDLMRLAYTRFSDGTGYSTEDFYLTAQEVAGIDLNQWFTQVVESTVELDYNEALAWFGLRFKGAVSPAGKDGPKAWLGIRTKTEGGRLIVTRVLRDTPGFQARIYPDDEILAIENYRVRPDQWSERLERYRSGDLISILVARRERLVTLQARLGAEPPRRWRLEIDPDATESQRQHFHSWLFPA